MSYQALAFFTGLFGSLHCVAMCGPLVMAIPFQGLSIFSVLFQRISYQAGRILVYTIIGLLAGVVGKQFDLLGWQKGLSVFSGLILILLALPYFLPQRFRHKTQFKVKFSQPLALLFSKVLTKPYGGVIAGALNGLLPCGMVYMALAASLNTGSAEQGASFMFFFGLGTTPLMLLTALAPILFKKRIKFSAVTPFLFLIIGSWLVIRGSNFNVPFIHEQQTPGVSSCK
ncbi:sulfite exporter TauE/SafE family protein [Desertivirga arenae]|uniref:sulfite exporter TauE/SafE family protein n=1 Tax=Desertivirga arenae TaxID=2810309 RepID=UPI001A96D8B4|nr:sulfite exporter TauE/SafE family protein [Pedobacter sp. SYSU D00823]